MMVDEATNQQISRETPLDDPESTLFYSGADGSELVTLILLICLALFLVFPVLNGFSLAPLSPQIAEGSAEQNIQFSMMLALIGSFIATSFYPIIGMLFLIMIRMAEPKDPRPERWLELCRQLCTLAMVGYLLLIPLQIVGVMKLGSSNYHSLDKSILSLEAFQAKVVKSRTMIELINVIESAPVSSRLGIPKVVRSPFRPFKYDVQKLVINRLWKERERRIIQQLQLSFNNLVVILRGSMLALVLAVVFAMFSMPPHQFKATFLSRLINPWRHGLQGLGGHLLH
jgi:hypothetical protein